MGSRGHQISSTTQNLEAVSALQFLETLLEDETVSLVDRYATGVILFAVYARARFGDLRKISCIILDSSDNSGAEHLGYLEMHSASHKMRATGNRLGAHLPLIAPLKGLGTSSWGKTFIKVAAQVGLDLTKWTPLTPLLPAPNAIGDWTSRATTSGETGRWIRHLLDGSNFDTNGFTPHGCKATTLAMLARYGADGDTRLVLGHHQTHRGASEVYARDVQSAPLRILEAMFKAIRLGHFRPDETRSGMFASIGVHDKEQVTEIPLPITETPGSFPGDLRQGEQDVESQAVESVDNDLESADPLGALFEGGSPSNDAPHHNEPPDTASDCSSSSTSDSDAESCLDEVVENLAQSPPQDVVAAGGALQRSQPAANLYQHRKSKVVHLLPLSVHSFLCGRQLSDDYYRQCSQLLVVDSMKCQQCRRHAEGRVKDNHDTQVEAVVKRARRG